MTPPPPPGVPTPGFAPIPPPGGLPSYPPPYPPVNQDEEHLRLLSLGAYIVGALQIVFHSFFLMHVFMGIMALNGDFFKDKNGQAMPPFFGWIFIIMGSVAVLYGWIVGGFTVYMGRCIAQRRKKLLIQIVAALDCLNMPLGTLLGVFIFIVLSRPTVAAQFDIKT